MNIEAAREARPDLEWQWEVFRHQQRLRGDADNYHLFVWQKAPNIMPGTVEWSILDIAGKTMFSGRIHLEQEQDAERALKRVLHAVQIFESDLQKSSM